MRKSRKIPARIRQSLAPPELITVSECADKFRYLSLKAARPGKWETNFVPFNRQVMDAFAEDCVEEIWYVKPSQTGGTDAILNMILYAVLQDPGPAMIVEPNEALADEISQERIDEMMRTCEALKEVQSLDMNEITKKKKTFSNMTLYFAWAGSPTSLASRPIRYVFFDEVNKYPPFSGQESSPLALGKERTNTFILNRKLIYVSTPTIENGYISLGESSCDARFRLKISCPSCGFSQQLVFNQVKWPEGERDPVKVENNSWYECEKCTARIFETEKMEMVRRGNWIDIKSDLNFIDCLSQTHPKKIGFQINRLYSPWHTFGMVAAEFLRSKDDPMNLMNWKNAWMAEEFIERIYGKKEDDILNHKNDLDMLIVPEHTKALTAGIDPGQGGFWFVVLAWIQEKTIVSVHMIHHGFLTNWESVREIILERRYPGKDNSRYPIWRTGIDTGGSEYGDESTSMTEDAYKFLRRFASNRIFGTKGIKPQPIHRMRASIIDKMPGGNQPIPGGITLWLIDTAAIKDILHYRLQVNPGEPGGITFHSQIGDDFAKHILAEEKRRNRKGEIEWITISRTNHWLDCITIALAMGDDECWGGIKLLSKEYAVKPEINIIEREIKAASTNEIEKRTMRKMETEIPKDWLGDKKGWFDK